MRSSPRLRATAHALYTIFTVIFGTSFSDTTRRPNPRSATRLTMTTGGTSRSSRPPSQRFRCIVLAPTAHNRLRKSLIRRRHRHSPRVDVSISSSAVEHLLFFDWSEGSTRPSGSLRRISSTLLRRALRPASPLPIMRAPTMFLWRVSLSELRHTISWSPETSA
jgi:hypothetical protein